MLIDPHGSAVLIAREGIGLAVPLAVADRGFVSPGHDLLAAVVFYTTLEVIKPDPMIRMHFKDIRHIALLTTITNRDQIASPLLAEFTGFVEGFRIRPD